MGKPSDAATTSLAVEHVWTTALIGPGSQGLAEGRRGSYLRELGGNAKEEMKILGSRFR